MRQKGTRWKQGKDICYPTVFLLLCMCAVTLAVMIVAGLVLGLENPDSQQVLQRLPGLPLIINILFYGITLISQRKLYRNDQLRFGVYHRRWKASGILAACLLTLCAGHLWSGLIDLSGLGHIFTAYAESASKAFEGQNPFLLLAATVLTGPLAEEMIFRGMTYRRAKYYLGTGWAMGISSLLFGLYHGNVIQFLYAAGLGLLLAALYERSRSLLVPVLAHMTANLWAIFGDSCLGRLEEVLPSARILLLVVEALVTLVGIGCLMAGKEKE